MLTEIDRRTRAVEAHSREKERLNEELERRVQERTAELESSNRGLAIATEVAEKASRAKSEFLSSMSLCAEPAPAQDTGARRLSFDSPSGHEI